jgi:hypothetical protein
MKLKFTTFLVGFLIYGILFGSIMYFSETDKSFNSALASGLIFGIAMGLFEVFINPRIVSYFANKRKNK